VRDGALFGDRQVDRLHAHAAGRHRQQDGFGAAILERRARRRAPLRGVVAGRAGVLVDVLGVHLRERRGRREHARGREHAALPWRLPVKVPSPMPAIVSVPFTESLLSIVPLYVFSSFMPWASTENWIVKSLPFTVPVTSASPNVPAYLPVSFSPSCFSVNVGEPVPASVWTLKAHLPVMSTLSCA